MLKRFRRNKNYTLCLVREGKDGDPYTWSVAVTYKGEGIFVTSEETYVMNGRECHIIDGDNTIKVHCSNIVNGWFI